MPTVFITGGTGFLGRHLVEQSLADGWRVVALHRSTSDTTALREAGADLVEGRLLDPDSLLRAVPEGCEAVLHAAADTTIWRPHAERQLRTNIDGTVNVARAALARGARKLVFVSSVAAWGAPPDAPITEETPLRGRDSWVPYKRSKHLAEEALREVIADGLDATIVNPCHILGPYDRGTWARMLRMVHDRSLPGVPGGSGVFCDVREVARAVRAAVEHGTTGEAHLLGGPHATFVDLLQVIGAELDRPVPARPTPDWLIRGVAWAKDRWSRVTGVEPDVTPEGLTHVLPDLRVDDTRARERLGYRHTPLPDLIADTAAWMRTEGLLA